MTHPVVRVASATAHAFAADKLPLPSIQICQQLVVTALLGDFVTSFEDTMAKGLPIVIDKSQAADTRGRPRTWDHQLRDDSVFARAGRALDRARERLGLSQLPHTEFEFLKLRVSNIVTTQIREQGLFVYSQKLLFSPSFAAIGMEALKHMKLPELQPTAASVAVATGHLPPLPSRNLKEHLRFLNAQPMRGFQGPQGLFGEWIAKASPVVVEFPAPNLEAGRQCRSDRFTTVYRPSAELGMGFFLATTYDQIGDRLSVVTPMLFHSAAPDGSPQPWRAQFPSTQIHLDSPPRTESPRLRNAMENFGGQSARLKVCPSCSEIYSDDRADLKLRCGCARAR